jgi:hypothetical protein
MFAQYTTISARSRGIKSEYALFKFFAEYYFSFILVLYCFFLGFYSFRSTYVLCPAPCVISENQKKIGKGAFFR